MANALLRRMHLDQRLKLQGDVVSDLNLSTGERKRLALVAALLEDRQLYVFDEWAANQDLEFKEVFYREILPDLRCRGKAVLVISHEDKFFDVADRIYRLDEGQLLPMELPAAVV